MRNFFLPSALFIAFALSACSGSNVASPVPQQQSSASSASGASSASAASSATRSAARLLRSPLGATSIAAQSGGKTSQQVLCSRLSDAKHASCFSSVLASSTIRAAFPDDVYGLTPNDLSSLYAYPKPAAQGSLGAGQTVAVVVAGDYPKAEADLAVYRQYFGLPPCTVANGCFNKIGPNGVNLNGVNLQQIASASSISAFATSISAFATSISAFATTTNASGWAAETDADIDVISAVCPNCKITIAEAPSDSLADLSNAVASAITAHATIVNASFGAPETSADTAFVAPYSNPHVKVVAAAGDWGYGVFFPASFNTVVAVGGTSLSVNGSTATETVWSGSGSGCSAIFARMSWQHNPTRASVCATRNVADVSAVADPNTGVAVYDSTLNGSSGGWATFGGTSIATPIITGMYALSGDTANSLGAEHLYASWSSFLPVTSGSNGTCSFFYLCNATSTYSGPTGLGIPQGLGGF